MLASLISMDLSVAVLGQLLPVLSEPEGCRNRDERNSYRRKDKYPHVFAYPE
jgi:hypothetical protein